LRKGAILGRTALIVFLVAGLLVLAYPGYRESNFPDARGARESGHAGMIPAFIPDAAKDIRTLTNLDTMQHWGCFHLPDGTREFRTHLAAEGAVRREGESLPKAGKMLGWVTWWPATMSEVGIERYDLHSPASRGVTMIGLSARDNRVCFYGGGNAG